LLHRDLVPFFDRRQAGQRLAEELLHLTGSKPVVLAAPRGGVPVAFEVARRLRAPLDVLVVRKLAAPGHPELAMGAIADGGALVLNHEILELLHVTQAELRQEQLRQSAELARRAALYRGSAPPLAVHRRCVIAVDDGLATGASMRVMVEAIRQSRPQRIIVATPVASREARDAVGQVADYVVCLETPRGFQAVGAWYQNFEQTSDEEVVELLQAARVPLAQAM
jgi:putative phosphoribosyl transferase